MPLGIRVVAVVVSSSERCCLSCTFTLCAQNPKDGGFPGRTFRGPHAATPILTPSVFFQRRALLVGLLAYTRALFRSFVVTPLFCLTLSPHHPRSALAYIVDCIFRSIVLS